MSVISPPELGLFAQLQRVPWSEDFQMLRVHDTNRPKKDQKAQRTGDDDGFVRIGRGGLAVEGRGCLDALEGPSTERRRCSSRQHKPTSPRNLGPEATRLVTDRLCCPTAAAAGVDTESPPPPSPFPSRARVAPVVLPRAACQVLLAPVELSCVRLRQPDPEALPEVVATGSGRRRRPLLAHAAAELHAWTHLQQLDDVVDCHAAPGQVAEAVGDVGVPAAPQVLFDNTAAGEGTADGISTLCASEEDDDDWEWESEEEEEEVAAPPKAKPALMGGIPASLLTRWNWNYSNNDDGSESEDEIDEMSPYSTYEGRLSDFGQNWAWNGPTENM